jgi:hypothetical protein
MPPPPHSDPVADDQSTDGSEPVYTPPSSDGYTSSPSDKHGPELTPSTGRITQLSQIFGVNDNTPYSRVGPEDAAQYAAAIKTTIDTFHAILNSTQSCSTNTENLQDYLEGHLEHLYYRYDIARHSNGVPCQYLGHNGSLLPGFKCKTSAISPVETTVTSSVKVPVVEDNNGRSTETFTSSPVQTQKRSTEELKNTNFFSLNLEEKARILLPLLKKVHPVTMEPLHLRASYPGGATLLENQFGTSQGTSSVTKDQMYGGKAHVKSPTEALDDIPYKMFERIVEMMPEPSGPITAGSPSTAFSPIHKMSTSHDLDGIERTLKGASPKLTTFEKVCTQMRDQWNMDQDVSDKQQQTPASSMRDDLEVSDGVSSQLAEMSLGDYLSGDDQGPDQERPDWLEDLLRDEDDEVYIGDPPGSPWQSQKQSDCADNWGDQGRYASTEALARAFDTATAAAWSHPFAPSENGGPEFLNKKNATHSPHPKEASWSRTKYAAEQEFSTHFFNAFFEQSAALLVQGKELPSKSQTFNFINKKRAERSEQLPSTEDMASKRIASEHCARPFKHAVKLPYVPLSSISDMAPQTTNRGEDQPEHMSDDPTNQPHHDLSGEDVQIQVSDCNKSVAECGSSWSAQETAGFDHRGDSDIGSAKDPFSRCDSCDSREVSVDRYGVDCNTCGIYTERPNPRHAISHEQVSQEKDTVSNKAAILPAVSSNLAGGSNPLPTTSVNYGYGAPSLVHSLNTADLAGGWNTAAPSALNNDQVWTKKQDQDLLCQKAFYPMRPWAQIADKVGLPPSMCRERFKVIRPEQSKPKLTKKQKQELKKKQCHKAFVPKTIAGIAKQDTCPNSDVIDASEICRDIFGNFEGYNDAAFGGVNNTIPEQDDCWGSIASVSENPGTGDDTWGLADTSRCDYGWPNTRIVEDDNVCGNGGGVEEGGCDDRGLGDSHPGLCSPSLTERVFGTKSTPVNPASKNYIVTYWATVECDDQIIHIPIDNNNISGPEKIILDGPARKVWKWIQEKGFSGKFGLQDAFDLAKDLHSDDEEEASNSCPLPKPLYPPGFSRTPSPLPTGQYENWCNGCGEVSEYCGCKIEW